MIELSVMSLILIFLSGALVGGLTGQYLTHRSVNRMLKKYMRMRVKE